MDLSLVEQQALTVVSDVQRMADLRSGQILVIGCSTSEVLGEHIGKAGSQEVAAALYRAFSQVQQAYGFALAFQCCEHLNRALVMERTTMDAYGLEEVSVVPVPSAGGSMAAYAYGQMQSPVVVEHLRADAGIDIGDTLIGMHLRHVAVPIRPTVRQIGQAHVTAARTRPKLIGGSRAVYERTVANQSCQ
ncbi:TIGR01440 family protein [Brevibacillus humidisoli]|uniref:TIGR01440 family protein n=1 Tax=Brevibacillus humidisoli TaxID=2895522 RepID=UPI001E3B14D5|nr:TIGR01440 family protein [Brevibacillus humidisoli]UFJ40186.1 TIGR01440 family protein [Brevibacillus humidisoli]